VLTILSVVSINTIFLSQGLSVKILMCLVVKNTTERNILAPAKSQEQVAAFAKNIFPSSLYDIYYHIVSRYRFYCCLKLESTRKCSYSTRTNM
jgi:hypothetical protein